MPLEIPEKLTDEKAREILSILQQPIAQLQLEQDLKVTREALRSVTRDAEAERRRLDTRLASLRLELEDAISDRERWRGAAEELGVETVVLREQLRDVRERAQLAARRLLEEQDIALAAETKHADLLRNHRAAMAEALEEIGRLRAIAQDWLNVMEADGYECTCSEGDTCPRCRCEAALGPQVAITTKTTELVADLPRLCLGVACPLCGAPPSEECIGASGRWHYQRYAAACDVQPTATEAA